MVYLHLFGLQLMVVGVPGEVGLPVVKHVVVLRLHGKETVTILLLRMEASRVNQKMLKKLRVIVINPVKVSTAEVVIIILNCCCTCCLFVRY